MASLVTRGVMLSAAACASYGSTRLGVWSLDTRDSKQSLEAVKRTVRGEIDYGTRSLTTPPEIHTYLAAVVYPPQPSPSPSSSFISKWNKGVSSTFTSISTLSLGNVKNGVTNSFDKLASYYK